MKRFLTILFVLTFAASAYGLEFAWTLSDSSTDPLSNTGTAVAGLVNVYLWYYCTSNAQGLASAEFDIAGSAVPLSFTPAGGFLNAGGATNLLLAVGGCPSGPIMAGTFLYYDVTGAGFNACIVPSAANALNVSVNCVELQIYPNDYAGYANDGTAPCQSGDPSLFCLIAVENASWGNIKSLYR
jgi:hypothetical protein